MNAVSKADVVRTRGNKPLIDPMVAEVAFECGLLGVVERYGIVRAGFDAALASCARVVIEDAKAASKPARTMP